MLDEEHLAAYTDISACSHNIAHLLVKQFN